MGYDVNAINIYKCLTFIGGRVNAGSRRPIFQLTIKSNVVGRFHVIRRRSQHEDSTQKARHSGGSINKQNQKENTAQEAQGQGDV
jgi:hypothetical protein